MRAVSSMSVMPGRLRRFGCRRGGGIHFGLDDIDAATIRLTAPRGFTQEISRLVYAWPADEGVFAGIRYQSRLGDQFVNWVMFEAPEGTSVISAGGGRAD